MVKIFVRNHSSDKDDGKYGHHAQKKTLFLVMIVMLLTSMITISLYSGNALITGESSQIHQQTLRDCNDFQKSKTEVQAFHLEMEENKDKNVVSAPNPKTEEYEDNIDNNENDVVFPDGEKIYYEAALSLEPTTDKVTLHSYQMMYGQFLLPYYYKNPNMKMLEIGLGCDMGYGPGASVALYKKLFPKAEIWEAEYDHECVENSIKNKQLEGINTITGDQGNVTVLDRWIKQTGGNFDVVINDGGHKNCQIWTSFLKLWPHVKPGGLYFIEDLQVAEDPAYMTLTNEICDKNVRPFEMIQEFVKGLTFDEKHVHETNFVFCQSEACVIGKR